MNERNQANKDDAGMAQDARDDNESSIGTGKRVGLYGCGFLLLGLVVIAIVIYLTGVYVPFKGTEGVGP